MRYAFLVGLFLAYSSLSATYASTSTEKIIYCYDQTKRLIANFSAKNIQASYKFENFCEGIDCADADPRPQSLLHLDQKADATLITALYRGTTMDTKFMYVYKIFKIDEWVNFQEAGEFLGSVDDHRDGFIHLATSEQVDNVVKKYFFHEEAVYIAEFLTWDLCANLKWEPGATGSIYPHLYKVPLKLGYVKNFEKRTLQVDSW